MFKITHRGNFNNLERFLNKVKNRSYLNALDAQAQAGVQALAANTPRRTGLTAASWTYEITSDASQTTITWLNTNVNNHVNIAIILQFGHGTGTGGYVQGYDYINPAIRPIFDQISDNVWKVVTSA